MKSYQNIYSEKLFVKMQASLPLTETQCYCINVCSLKCQLIYDPIKPSRLLKKLTLFFAKNLFNACKFSKFDTAKYTQMSGN